MRLERGAVQLHHGLEQLLCARLRLGVWKSFDLADQGLDPLDPIAESSG